MFLLMTWIFTVNLYLGRDRESTRDKDRDKDRERRHRDRESRRDRDRDKDKDRSRTRDKVNSGIVLHDATAGTRTMKCHLQLCHVIKLLKNC